MNSDGGEDTNKSPLKQIRTFQGDVAEALKNQNESLVSIQRAEVVKTEAKKIKEKKPPDPEARQRFKTVALVAGTLVLLLAAIAGGWYSYTEITRKLEPPYVPPSENRLISVTRTVELNASGMNKSALITAVQAAAGADLSNSETLHIDLREKSELEDTYISSQNLLQILGSRAQGGLIRALQPVFMYGVLGGEPKSNFLLIRLSSFENAFPGMLAWEKYIIEDIGELFGTRAKLRILPQDSVFEDITTRNKDARVLRDETGRIVFLYSFFDTHTLIITENDESLRTLIGRLGNAELTR
jgi:hypothetical protein